MTLAEVSSSGVYVWYSHIQPDKTVEIVSDVVSRAEQGEQVFFPIYTEEEMDADPSKRDTGLFFFRGEPGATFAVVNAGGGFMYVGAMHDSFPHALELSRIGYNAFALIYRPHDPYTDLAQAIAYIYDHAEELQVDPKGYSLWGGSAGARMAAELGNGDAMAAFGPDEAMSRAMLATVLWRMAERPAADGPIPFSDVPEGAWYTQAVGWAASAGLISGYGSGRFGTDDPVTREQIAAILWRYEGQPWADGGTDFADEADISPWAVTAVDWARVSGVLHGRDGNRFVPQDSASRAEVAAILMNYLQAKQGQTGGPAVTPVRPDGDTVATAVVTHHEQQTLYLWEEGNAPAVTEYTVNNGNYSDEPDFRPYLTFYPVPKGTAAKGAVLICPGGAFMFRSDGPEGISVAQALSERGYQSFVVDYRLRPYTQQEGALDLARAVRFVRAHADEFGIDEQDIDVMGFSAGDILAGEMLLHWDGTVSPKTLDLSYTPDELDRVSADAAADGMIYSFYGRLSVGTTDVALLRSGELPPTFYCYGTRDPFYQQFLANANRPGYGWSGSRWTICPTALGQGAAGYRPMMNF